MRKLMLNKMNKAYFLTNQNERSYQILCYTQLTLRKFIVDNGLVFEH